MRTLLACLFLTATIASQGFAAVAATHSDAEVASLFRAKLAKSKLAVDGIEIRVQGGIATLTGRTEVLQHKGTATRMAKSAGARQVNNLIRISEKAREAAAEKLAAGRAHAAEDPRRSRSNAGSAMTRPTVAQTSQAATKPVAPAGSDQAPPPVRKAQVKH